MFHKHEIANKIMKNVSEVSQELLTNLILKVAVILKQEFDPTTENIFQLSLFISIIDKFENL